jgi:Tfp pilus assembly PilM family ATPase
MFNPLSQAFGLDIGDRSFKVIQMVCGQRADKPCHLAAWGSISVPEGVMDKGEVLNMAQAADYINRLISQTRGIKGRAVVACLPEAKSFVKTVEVDAGMSEAEIRQIVAKEIEMNIPLKTDEIYFDWQVIQGSELPAAAPVEAEPESFVNGPAGPAKDGQATSAAANGEQAERKAAVPKSRILIAAAPKNLIDGYSQMLEAAGLVPLAFEIEAVAMARAIIPLDEQFAEAIGVLDLGATRSSLVIYDGGILQMSISIPISGYELTKVISEQLQVSESDAELVKIECGLDANRCEDRMWKILLPVIDDMCAKIKNALRFYKVGFPMGKKIERLYLCGGGAHFREIDSVLSRKLTIKVRRGDAMINTQIHKNFPEEKSLTYATAIGLALRAVAESRRYSGGIFRN